jgi:hypothetical protein
MIVANLVAKEGSREKAEVAQVRAGEGTTAASCCGKIGPNALFLVARVRSDTMNQI